MDIIFYVVFKTLYYAIEAITVLMLIRAVLSWFPGIRIPTKFSAFLYGITEFFISPVRTFLMKIGFVQRFPLDLSFLATYFLLHALQGMLSALYYGLIY